MQHAAKVTLQSTNLWIYFRFRVCHHRKVNHFCHGCPMFTIISLISIYKMYKFKLMTKYFANPKYHLDFIDQSQSSATYCIVIFWNWILSILGTPSFVIVLNEYRSGHFNYYIFSAIDGCLLERHTAYVIRYCKSF